jgi:hypothetical protein
MKISFESFSVKEMNSKPTLPNGHDFAGVEEP